MKNPKNQRIPQTSPCGAMSGPSGGFRYLHMHCCYLLPELWRKPQQAEQVSWAVWRREAHVLGIDFTREECWDWILRLDSLFWREGEVNGHNPFGLHVPALLSSSCTATNCLQPFAFPSLSLFLSFAPTTLFTLLFPLLSIHWSPLIALCLPLVPKVSPKPSPPYPDSSILCPRFPWARGVLAVPGLTASPLHAVLAR